MMGLKKTRPVLVRGYESMVMVRLEPWNPLLHSATGLSVRLVLPTHMDGNIRAASAATDTVVRSRAQGVVCVLLEALGDASRWKHCVTSDHLLHVGLLSSLLQARMLLEDPNCADAILGDWSKLLQQTLAK
jgi:hypothetical protein